MTVTVRYRLFLVSLGIAALLLVVSVLGISDHPYEAETAAWKLQCLGQDLIDLSIILPALLVASLLLYWKPEVGELIWPGVLLYLVYTFVIYCFAVHFNVLFLLYCLILGLSVHALLYFLFHHSGLRASDRVASPPLIKIIAVYFLTIALVFSAAWLMDIISAFRSADQPHKLAETGLLTNPVHVLDLAIYLPWFFLAGILLLVQKPLGLYLACYLLSFSILMNLTILVLDVMEENNLVMRVMFSSLAVLSLVLLILLVRLVPQLLQKENSPHENSQN